MNWPDMIREITRAGLSERQIGARIGCSGGTVNQLKNGYTKQPLYDIGAKLVDLHARLTQAGLMR